MPARGCTLPVHEVQCLDCAVPMQRKTYWRAPRCLPCARRRNKTDEARRNRELRQQARRYRILLHTLGWDHDQWEEMLEECRRSPMSFRAVPETRAARHDLAIERRFSRLVDRSTGDLYTVEMHKPAHAPGGDLGRERRAAK